MTHRNFFGVILGSKRGHKRAIMGHKSLVYCSVLSLDIPRDLLGRKKPTPQDNLQSQKVKLAIFVLFFLFSEGEYE